MGIHWHKFSSTPQESKILLHEQYNTGSIYGTK
jgi:hypothetical protein